MKKNHKIEIIRNRGYSELDDCIEWIRIIQSNPIDKKLLKQEMYQKFSDYTVKLARKLIREGKFK